MVDEILDQIDLVNKTVLVLFNPEFVVGLIERGVTPSNITLLADCRFKKKMAENLGVNYVTPTECHEGESMEFDVVVGNPPFSKVSKATGRGRGKDLYPIFFERAIDMAPVVAMIMPSTHDRVFAKHNALLRQVANKIIHIDPSTFSKIVRDVWYVIKDNSGSKPDIEWLFDDSDKNDIDFAKGKLNVTTDKHMLGRTKERKCDITIYHKITGSGLVTNYCKAIEVPQMKLFPSSGWAVLMPQQITKNGWPKVEIVKCVGNQAAMNGVNIAFFKTKKEAQSLVEYMSTDQFILSALRYVGGMGNMTKTAMNNIDMSGLQL